MKRCSIFCFIILLCVFNPKVSKAEPGFFLQTLTNRFVDWVFGRIDTYIEDKPDQSKKILNEKSIIDAEKPSEKKVSIETDEVVKRDNTYYKKFSNVPFSGYLESYYPNGQLKIIGGFSDGKKVGEWIEYYMNGIKKSEGQFVSGKKDGAWVYYFLNANIKEKQFYNNGNKDGLWEKFNVNGAIVQTESYQNGKWIITTIN
jgi:antitoxin component YwqK of YwqJK toxin-antitoxin module